MQTYHFEGLRTSVIKHFKVSTKSAFSDNLKVQMTEQFIAEITKAARNFLNQLLATFVKLLKTNFIQDFGV